MKAAVVVKQMDKNYCNQRMIKLQSKHSKCSLVYVHFSISNNRASDKLHWLRYCHCAKLVCTVVKEIWVMLVKCDGLLINDIPSLHRLLLESGGFVLTRGVSPPAVVLIY